MKCNSVVKHNLKVFNKKFNPPQGQFMDLIISVFYCNRDIFDCAYKFINSIIHHWKIKDDIIEISGKIPIHTRVWFSEVKLPFKPKLSLVCPIQCSSLSYHFWHFQIVVEKRVWGTLGDSLVVRSCINYRVHAYNVYYLSKRHTRNHC